MDALTTWLAGLHPAAHWALAFALLVGTALALEWASRRWPVSDMFDWLDGD